jgi:hypothetical protein
VSGQEDFSAEVNLLILFKGFSFSPAGFEHHFEDFTGILFHGCYSTARKVERKMFKIIILLLVLSTIIGCRASNSAADYDKIVTFSQDKPVKFSDFELTYVGERKQTSTFPNGNSFTFTYNVFKIKNENKADSVAWTSGTGEIGPIYFEFRGSKYSIELKYWEKEKKKLDEDELVITKLTN